ncbi:MAG: hypothetical protein J6D38_07260 [Solobacterium sp.]|nr:hypothetical protein [Solobacterium sp.]
MCIAIDEMLADTEREKQGRLQALKELEKYHNELEKCNKELEKSNSNLLLLIQMLNERGCNDEEINSYLNKN